MTIYVAAKVLEELAVWKFADEHPDIDITTSEWPSRFTAEYGVHQVPCEL